MLKLMAGTLALTAIIAALVVLGIFYAPSQLANADGPDETPTAEPGATTVPVITLRATWPCEINGVQITCSMDMEGPIPFGQPTQIPAATATPAATPTSSSQPVATATRTAVTTPSQQACVEPNPEPHEPTRGENWPIVAGDHYLVVEIWSNQDDPAKVPGAQTLYRKFLKPGESITIRSGGGSIETFPSSCGDAARKDYDRLGDEQQMQKLFGSHARPELPDNYRYLVR